MAAPVPAPPQAKPTAKAPAVINPPGQRPPYWQENRERQAAQTNNTPGGILSGLTTTPASQLGAAFTQATVHSKTALNKQKDEATKQLPVVDESSGSAFSQSQAATARFRARNRVANSRPVSPANPGVQPPVFTLPDIPQQATIVSPNINFRSAGNAAEVDPHRAQEALDGVELDISDIPTTAEAPVLDLQGEADPAQLTTDQQQQGQEVTDAKNEAALEINNDFGENGVIKRPGHTKLKASHVIQSKLPKAKPVAPGKVPTGQTQLTLNAQFAPVIQEKIGAESARYDAGQADYEAKSTAERQKADGNIDAERRKSQRDQLSAQSDAQGQVSQSRQEWHTELNTVETNFNTSANAEAIRQNRQIQTKQTEGNAEAQRHIADGNREAEAKRNEAKEEGRQKQESSKRESKGFFGWLGDKVSSLINALKSALNFIFDKLRKAVTWIFDKVKRLALAALELARKAIVGFIKAFGEFLKGLVEVAFAAFPTLRDRIKAKIDGAVQRAEAAVNAAFEFFKKAVSAIIDALAAVVDSILGALQFLYNAALTVIEFVTVGILRVMDLLTDIDRLYNLFKTMVDGFRKIWNNPEILEKEAKKYLQPYIDKIPGETQSEVKKALAVLGLATAKHLTGILKYLTPTVNKLIANWWGEAKKMIWFLIWPFAEGSPLWEDAPKLWHLIPQIYKDARAGEFSKAIDGGLEWMQALNMTVGAFAGWIAIGGAIIGAIVGGIMGAGVGAIPGAGAGFEIGVAIGEGILVSMIATEGLVITKAVYDLSVTDDDEQTEPESNESSDPEAIPSDGEQLPVTYTSGSVKTNHDRIQYAYQRIANSGLTLGIMVALMILGAIGGKIAQALLAGVKKLGGLVADLLPNVAKGVRGALGAIKETKAFGNLADAARRFNAGRKAMRQRMRPGKYKASHEPRPFESKADPVRDYLGPGHQSHPVEWEAMLQDMREAGVEIQFTEPGNEQFAYGPGLRKGEPGTIKLDPDASISALRHEYQHFLDDRAGGYRGMASLFDDNYRYSTEFRAYMEEIKLMRKHRRFDIARELLENLRAEKARIFRLDELPTPEPGGIISPETRRAISTEITQSVQAEIALTKSTFGHTFTTHGEEMTTFLTNRARGSGIAQGQFLDNQAAARFIKDNLGATTQGATSLPMPEGFPARMINPDGTFGIPTKIKLVPGGKGVKTAYPEY
ncbi:hypothetical protein [Larkinella rosea]|uniref:Uncharacterized protein n=1 Tax=Larkinella rosea TaxID=2025312 RepID=A0A3P1C303_9BACT|nr:hypothetical protein [Larkinella rosea]RRB07765.1 hypothetical protein EHT25_08320 [Larkinella rosea]